MAPVQLSKKFLNFAGGICVTAALGCGFMAIETHNAPPLPPQEREAAKLNFVRESIRQQIRSQLGTPDFINDNRETIDELAARIVDGGTQTAQEQTLLPVTIDAAKALSRAEDQMDGTRRSAGLMINTFVFAYLAGAAFNRARKTPSGTPGGSAPSPL